MHQHQTRGEDWQGLDQNVLVPRYCIEPTPPGKLPRDGQRRKDNAAEWWAEELPLHTGLYVHQPRRAGKAHYAVTALVDGVENTRDVTAACQARSTRSASPSATTESTPGAPSTSPTTLTGL